MNLTPESEPSPTEQLQRAAELAGELSRLETASPFVVALRVAYGIGIEFPWRIHETWVRADPHEVCIKQMLCFKTAERIVAYLDQRLNWRKADSALLEQVLNHEIPAKLSETLQKDGPVFAQGAIQQVLKALEARRLALSKQMVTLQPDRAINLLKTPAPPLE
jgi:hypothetical protein